MAITTYAELQAAAANWLVRADLTARIPEFIALAEARLNRVMRARLAEAEVSLSAGAGVRTLALPAGFTEPLRLWIERATGRDEVPFREAGLIGVSARLVVLGVGGGQGGIAGQRLGQPARHGIVRLLQDGVEFLPPKIDVFAGELQFEPE